MITRLNIDDFIRECLRKGLPAIPHTEESWAVLNDFKPGIVEGDSYLGIKHYLCA